MINTFLFPFDGDITSENLQKKLELLNQFDEICSYFADEVIIGDKTITEDGQTVYVFRPLPLIDIDSYFTDKANGKQRELLYVSYPGACCPLRPEKFSSLRNVNLNTAQTIEAFPLITDPDANAGVIQRATADTDYLAGATAAQNAQTFETAVNAFTPIWWKELITKKENLKQFQEDIISFEDVLAEDDIAELGLIYSTHCMRKFLPPDANDKPLDNKDCLYSFIRTPYAYKWMAPNKFKRCAALEYFGNRALPVVIELTISTLKNILQCHFNINEGLPLNTYGLQPIGLTESQFDRVELKDTASTMQIKCLVDEWDLIKDAINKYISESEKKKQDGKLIGEDLEKYETLQELLRKFEGYIIGGYANVVDHDENPYADCVVVVRGRGYNNLKQFKDSLTPGQDLLGLLPFLLITRELIMNELYLHHEYTLKKQFVKFFLEKLPISVDGTEYVKQLWSLPQRKANKISFEVMNEQNL